MQDTAQNRVGKVYFFYGNQLEKCKFSMEISWKSVKR